MKKKRGGSESIQTEIIHHFLPIMVGSILAMIMVCIIVLMLSGYTSETRSLHNNVNLATRQINLMLEQIRDNSRAFATTSRFQATMEKQYDQNSNARRNFVNEIRSSIFSFVNIEPFAGEMTLVSEVGMTYLYPSGAVVPSSLYTGSEWYKDTVSRNGRVHMYTEKEYMPSTETLQSNLILEKSIIHTQTGELLGAMRIKVRENLFSDTFPAIQKLVGGKYYILDDSGTIIASEDKSELFTRLDGSDSMQFDSMLSVPFLCRVNGRLQLTAVCRTNIIDWYVIGMVPFSSIFTKNSLLLLTMLITGIIFLGIASISMRLLARRLASPILSLVTATRNVSDGDLSAEIPVTSSDEIGQLAQSFNSMLEDVRTLTHQIWLEQHRKREYALQFMQTQINPHLLYNSIASVNRLIISGKNEVASAALTHLGQYYKKVLSKNNMSVTVEDDVELSRDYLILQQQIHSGLFEYSIDIAPEIMKCPFLKLTLQPIIENSILHGFKGHKTSGGLIRITGCVQDGCAHITVTDNGRGISPEMLALLQMPGDNTQHYGLRNIAERIAIRFGAQYKLDIKSEVGNGTSVTICVPVNEVL